MTLKGFFFLFVVTIVAVVSSAVISERVFAPGFERGILIAVLSGLVVFPAARWAEYRGWIRGEWSPNGELRKRQEARRRTERRQPAEDHLAAAQEPSSDRIEPAADGPVRSRHALPPGDSR